MASYSPCPQLVTTACEHYKITQSDRLHNQPLNPPGTMAVQLTSQTD